MNLDHLDNLAGVDPKDYPEDLGTADLGEGRKFPMTGPISLYDIWSGVVGSDPSGSFYVQQMDDRRVREHPCLGPVGSATISFNDMRGRYVGLHKEHIRPHTLSYSPSPRWTQMVVTPTNMSFPASAYELRSDNPQNHNDSFGDYMYGTWRNSSSVAESVVTYCLCFEAPGPDLVGKTLRLDLQYTFECDSSGISNDVGIWVVLVSYQYDWGSGLQPQIRRTRLASISDPDPKFKSARFNHPITSANMSTGLYWMYALEIHSPYGGSLNTTYRIANVKSSIV